MASKSLSATIFGIDKASPVFDQVGRNADDMAGDVEKSGSKIGDAFSKGAKIAAGAIAAIGFADFVRDTITQASNLEQNVGAVQAVFKDTSDEIMQFGSTSAETVGIAKQDYLQLAATFGSQLKNMGVASDQLAPKTNKLVTLGADLAAVYGGTASDAVDAISSLLRGERDPIERYGVSIKQASINAYELANHLDTSTAKAKTNADMQATLALLFEQTADAQGQFAAQTDTLAESQQIANAKFAEAKAEIGQKLLPIVTDFTNFAGDHLVPILGTVADVLGDAIDIIDGIPGPVKIALTALLGFKLFQQTQVFSKLATGLRGFRDEMALQQGLAKMEGQELTKMGAAATVSKTKIGGLAKSLGKGAALGAGIFVVSSIVDAFTHVNQSVKAVDDSVQDLSQSLVENGQKWDAALQKQYEQAVMNSDVFKSLTEGGLSYGDALAFLTGNMDKVTASNDEISEAMSNLSFDQIQAIGHWRTSKDEIKANAKSLQEYHDKVNGVTRVTGKQSEELKRQDTAYNDARAALNRYSDATGDSTRYTEKQGTAYNDARRALNDYGQISRVVAGKVQADAQATSDRVLSLARSFTTADGDADRLAASMDGVKAAMDRLEGKEPDVEAATRQFQGALTAAKEAAKGADGKVKMFGSGILTAAGKIKLGTKAGQGLYDTVTQNADAARDLALAQAKVAGKTGGVTAAAHAAAKSLHASKQAFKDNARQMGLTGKQAKKLADRYFGLPKDIKIEVYGVSDFSSVDYKLQRLADSTHYVNIQGRYVGTSGAPTRSFGSAMGFAASGGPVHPGRYVVGEEGYEVLDLYSDGSGYVHPHSDAVRLLAGAVNIGTRASGGPVGSPRSIPQPAAMPPIQLTVKGFVGSPQQLADVLAAPLADAVARGRRNGQIRAGAFA